MQDEIWNDTLDQLDGWGASESPGRKTTAIGYRLEDPKYSRCREALWKVSKKSGEEEERSQQPETLPKNEKANHITNSIRQTRATEGQRERRRRLYGQKLREDECLCGRTRAGHDRERCPGEQNDIRVADHAVIESLLGRSRMHIMERRGNMVIK